MKSLSSIILIVIDYYWSKLYSELQFLLDDFNCLSTYSISRLPKGVLTFPYCTHSDPHKKSSCSFTGSHACCPPRNDELGGEGIDRHAKIQNRRQITSGRKHTEQSKRRREKLQKKALKTTNVFKRKRNCFCTVVAKRKNCWNLKKK